MAFRAGTRTAGCYGGDHFGRWVFTPCSLHPIATPDANDYSDESIESIFTTSVFSRPNKRRIK